MASLVLLGPQRFHPTLSDTMHSLGVRGPVAVVTAGWQEREAEDDEMQAHLGCEVVDLQIYHRAEDVALKDPELDAALHERQSRLQDVQNLYRLRLGYLLDAARDLMGREGHVGFLAEHQREAIRAVRTLDRQHVRRLRALHGAFEAEWQPTSRPAVAAHRRELAAIVERVGALAVSGGHVAILLNRLRLFDFTSLCGRIPVVAWSAGAMALTDRVVLFHDSPPQGMGNPEILDAGLGLCPDVVALPHARRRLRLEDPVRVSLFARRFSPATCVVLDETARLLWDGESWHAGRGTSALGRRGRLRTMREA